MGNKLQWGTVSIIMGNIRLVKGNNINLFELILYVQIKTFSVMLGRFLG